MVVRDSRDKEVLTILLKPTMLLVANRIFADEGFVANFHALSHHYLYACCFSVVRR